MQTMKDLSEDKDLVVEELTAKANLLKDENMILKEAQIVHQKKFEDIYENHILIAKSGDSKKSHHDEEEEQKQGF